MMDTVTTASISRVRFDSSPVGRLRAGDPRARIRDRMALDTRWTGNHGDPSGRNSIERLVGV